MRRYRRIDDTQQTFVDFVAMRQDLVEVHSAHDGSDVRHGEHGDGVFQIGDFVTRLGRLEFLKQIFHLAVIGL